MNEGRNEQIVIVVIIAAAAAVPRRHCAAAATRAAIAAATAAAATATAAAALPSDARRWGTKTHVAELQNGHVLLPAIDAVAAKAGKEATAACAATHPRLIARPTVEAQPHATTHPGVVAAEAGKKTATPRTRAVDAHSAASPILAAEAALLAGRIEAAGRTPRLRASLSHPHLLPVHDPAVRKEEELFSRARPHVDAGAMSGEQESVLFVVDEEEPRQPRAQFDRGGICFPTNM